MENIITLLLGILCIILGLSNMKGNIKSLHFYHYKRVSEENILPFGKMVGLGTMIVGIGMILLSIMKYLALALNTPFYSVLGDGFMIAGIIIGLGLSIGAMFKYNGGIF